MSKYRPSPSAVARSRRLRRDAACRANTAATRRLPLPGHSETAPGRRLARWALAVLSRSPAQTCNSPRQAPFVHLAHTRPSTRRRCWPAVRTSGHSARALRQATARPTRTRGDARRESNSRMPAPTRATSAKLARAPHSCDRAPRAPRSRSDQDRGWSSQHNLQALVALALVFRAGNAHVADFTCIGHVRPAIGLLVDAFDIYDADLFDAFR